MVASMCGPRGWNLRACASSNANRSNSPTLPAHNTHYDTTDHDIHAEATHDLVRAGDRIPPRAPVPSRPVRSRHFCHLRCTYYTHPRRIAVACRPAAPPRPAPLPPAPAPHRPHHRGQRCHDRGARGGVKSGVAGAGAGAGGPLPTLANSRSFFHDSNGSQAACAAVKTRRRGVKWRACHFPRLSEVHASGPPVHGTHPPLVWLGVGE
jgi:hypothetical protein